MIAGFEEVINNKRAEDRFAEARRSVCPQDLLWLF